MPPAAPAEVAHLPQKAPKESSAATPPVEVASAKSTAAQNSLAAASPKVPAPTVASPSADPASAVPVPARTDSNGGRSLTRALGLKIGKVVIDPGHGGQDDGTTGLEGVVEKDLVLDVSRRLGQLIEERLQAEVVFTRDADVFVPLEARTGVANRAKADLFISIHANSSPVASASGVETYYLNFTTSKTAMEVAARENAGHNKSIHELQDLIQKIALRDKVDESREFASKVEVALSRGLSKDAGHIRDRGVKQAPFVVLIGAQMPSILTEIGFLSNPREAKLMKTPEYRQSIADALFEGISAYARTLSRFDVASKRGDHQGNAP